MKIKSKANPISLKKTTVVLSSLVVRSIKTQYRRSVLGIFWTVLNPLLNMLVMSFVFSNIFGNKNVGMDYAIYVLTGNIVFNLLRSSTTLAIPSIVNNYDLITKTRTPYCVFPLTAVATALVNFLFAMVALIVVMLFKLQTGTRFYWQTIYLFVLWLPSLLLFCTGISLFLSYFFVYFRDLTHLYNVLLLLWMYLTPVFYSLSSLNLGEGYEIIFQLNPMYHYLLFFRSAILGTFPPINTFLFCYGYGIGFLLLGMLISKGLKKRIIYYI